MTESWLPVRLSDVIGNVSVPPLEISSKYSGLETKDVMGFVLA